MNKVIEMLSNKGIEVWTETVHTPTIAVIIFVVLGVLLAVTMAGVCFVWCGVNLRDVVAAMRNKENKHERKGAICFVILTLVVSLLSGLTSMINVLPKTVHHASMTDEQLAYAIQSGIKVEHKDGSSANEYVIYGINDQEFHH